MTLTQCTIIFGSLTCESVLRWMTEDGYDGRKMPSCDLPIQHSLASDKACSPSAPITGFLSATIHGTIGFFSQELPFSLLIAAVLTSLGLWFASMIYISSPDKIAQDSSPPVQSSFEPTLEVVGKITGMVDCKWADPNTETFHGVNVFVRPASLP